MRSNVYVTVCGEAELPAGYTGIKLSPLATADVSPRVVVAHLERSFHAWWSVDQSYLAISTITGSYISSVRPYTYSSYINYTVKQICITVTEIYDIYITCIIILIILLLYTAYLLIARTKYCVLVFWHKSESFTHTTFSIIAVPNLGNGFLHIQTSYTNPCSPFQVCHNGCNWRTPQNKWGTPKEQTRRRYKRIEVDQVERLSLLVPKIPPQHLNKK